MSDDTETRDYQPVLDVEPQEPQAIARPQPDRRPEVQRPQVVRALDGASGQATQAQAQMRVIVRHSDDLGDLFGALAKAQGMFEDLERTRKARIESAKAKYEYEFETLADVIAATRKGLSENGLSVMQFPFPERGQMTLRTLVGHASGQWIYNDLTATIDGHDPRSEGSGITYLCRYARKAILGIAADWDDDAQAAQQAPPRGAPQPAQRVSQQQAKPPAAAQAPAVPAVQPQPDQSKGLIVAVEHRATLSGDVWYVKLDTDYAAATKVEALAQTATALKDAGRKVRLVTRAPSKPGYALNLTEIEVLEDQAN